MTTAVITAGHKPGWNQEKRGVGGCVPSKSSQLKLYNNYDKFGKPAIGQTLNSASLLAMTWGATWVFSVCTKLFNDFKDSKVHDIRNPLRCARSGEVLNFGMCDNLTGTATFDTASAWHCCIWYTVACMQHIQFMGDFLSDASIGTKNRIGTLAGQPVNN